MRALELTGMKFGRLSAISPDNGRTSGHVVWNCRCDCGKEIKVPSTHLKRLNTKSCGCLRVDNAINICIRLTKHGQSRSRTYWVWNSIQQRCFNPKHIGFKYYGGRGITVCNKWRKFTGFYSDMGDAPDDLTIDRINNDGNYEPGNCRWTDRTTQESNKRAKRL